MRPAWIIASAAVAGLLAGPALGAGKTEAELLAAMEKDVAKIADKLSHLEEQADTSRITEVIDLSNQVDAALADLKDLPPETEKGRRQAKEWPRATEELRAAAKTLKNMKELQREGVWTALPVKCAEAEQKLFKKLDELVQKDLPADDLEKEIKKAANQWEPGVRKAVEDLDKKLRDVTEGRANVNELWVPSDVRWEQADKNAKVSATAIVDTLRGASVKAHDACGKLALGEDHPEVQKRLAALEKEAATAEQAWEAISKAHERWQKRTAELVKVHDAEESVLRAALCEADEADDDTIVEVEIERVAERIKTKLAAGLKEVEDEASALQDACKELAQNEKYKGKKFSTVSKDIKDEANTLRTKVGKSVASLKKRAAGNGLYKGSSNPVLRTRMDFGKKKHNELQAACQEDEVTIRGANSRMDCVNVKSGVCWIIEIKPNTKSALARGNRQVADYRDRVLDLWADKGSAAFTGKLAIFLKCEDTAKKTLKIRTDLMPYDFCDKDLDLGSLGDAEAY